jgi:hypothetical protein
MSALKFKIDYNYKYVNSPEESKSKLKGNIVIWKTNNRLSYMRCLQFLEKFCKSVNITNIKVKTRTKKIKNYFAYEFDLEENLETLKLLQKKLPEPEITLQEAKYIITYNFYRFVIEIPVAVNDPYGLMKIYELFPLSWQDI